jgi:uncharacterized protein YciI
LLGGALSGDSGIDAAYVVRAAGVDEATKIAAEDPLVVNGLCSAQCLRWQLVAINPAALDRALFVCPTDVAGG